MMRRLALASALFVAVGSAAPSMAVAGTADSNFQISASVNNNCTISTAALSFGAYNPGTGTSVTGTVTTNCTAYALAVITLSPGYNSDIDNPAENRRLKNVDNANYLSYNLYKDNAKTAIWGSGSSTSTDTGITVIGNGADKSTTVYGEIPAGQNVPSGSYTDTVTATVTY
ncbi:spore coat U domain-containing protein [Dolichospermum sp. UHCC 0684]|uniref:Csu type fimbrial protein n=1 Tax=unclassified Dolichospermum TaxID=2622029 RepID=UPI001444F800|nr:MULTISPECIES: spore coat U domain-containing protein [unclassified Dolichospermum]MEA5532365.1 spore coat U domain-containing protein [Dolichospermum sp. UHCC 0684]MTJ37039.1 spore coat protein U domain-containing protein [Dolichospermum sp. UHCC 0260]